MRECLACEKQYDESERSEFSKLYPSSDSSNTYCSIKCCDDFNDFMKRRVEVAKSEGLINEEGQAIQSSENNPDVVRRIIGNLNIKLRGDK